MSKKKLYSFISFACLEEDNFFLLKEIKSALKIDKVEEVKKILRWASHRPSRSEHFGEISHFTLWYHFTRSISTGGVTTDNSRLVLSGFLLLSVVHHLSIHLVRKKFLKQIRRPIEYFPHDCLTRSDDICWQNFLSNISALYLGLCRLEEFSKFPFSTTSVLKTKAKTKQNKH